MSIDGASIIGYVVKADRFYILYDEMPKAQEIDNLEKEFMQFEIFSVDMVVKSSKSVYSSHE